jgi:hypothetical protein
MLKLIFKILLVFCVIFTVHSLARKNTTYNNVVLNLMPNSCDRDCKKQLFEAEMEDSMQQMAKSIMAELLYQTKKISEEKK